MILPPRPARRVHAEIAGLILRNVKAVCIQIAICGIISVFWICGFITTTCDKRDKYT